MGHHHAAPPQTEPTHPGIAGGAMALQPPARRVSLASYSWIGPLPSNGHSLCGSMMGLSSGQQAHRRFTRKEIFSDLCFWEGKYKKINLVMWHWLPFSARQGNNIESYRTKIKNKTSATLSRWHWNYFSKQNRRRQRCNNSKYIFQVAQKNCCISGRYLL